MHTKTTSIIKILTFACANVLLIGCASLKNNYELQHRDKSWKQHQKDSENFNVWNITGKIGVSDGNEGGNANLTWQQQQTHFDINLSGPFSAEAINISGKPEAVEFTTAKGVHLTASSAEEIIKQQLGWTVPVSGLVYWARGIPLPGIPVDGIQLSKEKRLVMLQQQGWNIEYLEYKAFDQHVLPTKINLKHQNIKIKLIFKNWL